MFDLSRVQEFKLQCSFCPAYSDGVLEVDGHPCPVCENCVKQLWEDHPEWFDTKPL
jgi:hypothetical protein